MGKVIIEGAGLGKGSQVTSSFCVLSMPSLAHLTHLKLRIDNGGLEYMCSWFCVFTDILAIHQSIRTYYISI